MTLTVSDRISYESVSEGHSELGKNADLQQDQNLKKEKKSEVRVDQTAPNV